MGVSPALVRAKGRSPGGTPKTVKRKNPIRVRPPGADLVSLITAYFYVPSPAPVPAASPLPSSNLKEKQEKERKEERAKAAGIAQLESTQHKKQPKPSRECDARGIREAVDGEEKRWDLEVRRRQTHRQKEGRDWGGVSGHRVRKGRRRQKERKERKARKARKNERRVVAAANDGEGEDDDGETENVLLNLCYYGPLLCRRQRRELRERNFRRQTLFEDWLYGHEKKR